MTQKDIVDYVADLARIELSAQEKAFLGNQLTKIIDYIDKLGELSVEGVEPMRGFGLAHNVVRDDCVRVFPLRDDILRNAPVRENDYFKVPKVIE